MTVALNFCYSGRSRPYSITLSALTRRDCGIVRAPCGARVMLAPLRAGAFRDAITPANLKVATHGRPVFVYSAQHGLPVQGGAPAVVPTRHDPPSPPVDFGQIGWNIILPEDHHLKPAAVGLAQGAGYDCVVAGFG